MKDREGKCSDDGPNEPDWTAIREALARNPEYLTALAQVEEAEQQGPPVEIDIRALFRELRGEEAPPVRTNGPDGGEDCPQHTREREA